MNAMSRMSPPHSGHNGMSLLNVKSCEQKVVLGLATLAAVLVDRLGHRS
jgi:ABC-type xylose transport system permease subunit